MIDRESVKKLTKKARDYVTELDSVIEDQTTVLPIVARLRSVLRELDSVVPEREPVTGTGAMIKAFYDEWPPGDDCFSEDAQLLDDRTGEWLLEPEGVYDAEEVGGGIADNYDDSSIKFSTVFARWLKKNGGKYKLVLVPRHIEQTFVLYCESQSVKILE